MENAQHSRRDRPGSAQRPGSARRTRTPQASCLVRTAWGPRHPMPSVARRRRACPTDARAACFDGPPRETRPLATGGVVDSRPRSWRLASGGARTRRVGARWRSPARPVLGDVAAGARNPRGVTKWGPALPPIRRRRSRLPGDRPGPEPPCPRPAGRRVGETGIGLARVTVAGGHVPRCVMRG